MGKTDFLDMERTGMIIVEEKTMVHPPCRPVCGRSISRCCPRERSPRSLQLTEEVTLLDVGAGAGWPGLFLADQSGCQVTLTDLPIEGLTRAVARARKDGIDKLCQAVVADGGRLPFADTAFDAVVHSDVLCCLPGKLSMLKECPRVVSPGGGVWPFR